MSTINGKALDAFIVRKEPRNTGPMKWVEGNMKKGAWVVIVDDVVTTGGSTILAIERAREEGLQVRRVIALVDRERGRKENIESKTRCKFESLFTKTDLMEMHKKMQKAIQE